MKHAAKPGIVGSLLERRSRGVTVNYSLLVMDSAGMMKMATGEGSPLRQGAKTGSREVFGGTEACGGGTPDLS